MKRSRWKSDRFLEWHPWSLLRDIGLSSRSGWYLQAVLLACPLIAYTVDHRSIGELLFAWLTAAYTLRYITQRLGGREAQLGIPRVTRDTTFQGRLSLDVLAIAIFGLAGLALLVGYDGWRTLVGGR